MKRTLKILAAGLMGWPYYGGDAGGSRYSEASQINRENVSRLQVAWTYRTGDVSDGKNGSSKANTCNRRLSLNSRLYV